MIRLARTFSILALVSWGSPATGQQSIELPGDPIVAADLGIETGVRSAVQLADSQPDAAARRKTLSDRLQCWIDGVEGCVAASANDPRVRAIRRFLALESSGRPGVFFVHFPDESRITVRIERRVPGSATNPATNSATDPDSLDWRESAYRLEVLPASVEMPGRTARAPGPAAGRLSLIEIPDGPDDARHHRQCA